MAFCRAVSWSFDLERTDVSYEVDDFHDSFLLYAVQTALLLESPDEVNADVGRHAPSLYLCPVVDGVDISHADPLQLANDASLVGSFETSPCNAWNHWRKCLEG